MTSLDLRCVARDQFCVADDEHLTSDCGLVDLSERTQLELRGKDRQTFLHNLCTNNIRDLTPGQGCEAFVTSVQGKCLGHILAYAGPESLIVDTVPDQAERLLAHFDRYLITEDVQLIDRCADWGELALVGPASVQVIQAFAEDWSLDQSGAHQRLTFNHVSAWVRRLPWTRQPAFLIATERSLIDALRGCLLDRGAAACAATALQTIRIENGFPRYGWDVTEQNLPQEVDRDTLAISFTKGCYLGQETVARIDALGHVNRTLVAVRIEQAEVPPAGTPLNHDGKTVGEITSSAYSPRLAAPLGLAYIRTALRQPGTRLDVAEGVSAEVVCLPITGA